MASPRLKSAKLAVKHTWPLVLMVLLDQAAYGVPVLRRIPLWARVLALATAIARAIQANRRRALLRSRLDGKRVLITGGASGIGLLLARRCVRHGAHVVIWDVQREACARALEELRALVAEGGTGSAAAHSIDVTDRERVYAEVERLRREAGGLDVVVLNAGIVSGTPVVRADEASMVRTMDVNAMSHFWLIKAVLPVMLESNSGQIVTISSAAAFGGGPGLADYCASKSASFAFTECVRMEVRKAGRMGVTVTTICPFLISTVGRAPLDSRDAPRARRLGRSRAHAAALCLRPPLPRPRPLGPIGNV